ncbi:EST gb/AV534270 comes from this gene [Arabidopsis thaliana]|uniref:T21E18.6 protein n=1 Tax=Arabidopsis thaliana TaxID=3702 RepID=Q9LNE5_ARATH|nr:EST gb/AV534270 comes from this gene [Arabidopsis thaliana]
MGREKSPGLKILWVWTIGTAASMILFLTFTEFRHEIILLVTSVVRTRMQDMQTMMNQNQEQAPKENQNGSAGDSSVLMDETVLPESDREIAEKL